MSYLIFIIDNYCVKFVETTSYLYMYKEKSYKNKIEYYS